MYRDQLVRERKRALFLLRFRGEADSAKGWLGDSAFRLPGGWVVRVDLKRALVPAQCLSVLRGLTQPTPLYLPHIHATLQCSAPDVRHTMRVHYHPIRST
eukprot:3158906-Rhodomonas_salina.4